MKITPDMKTDWFPNHIKPQHVGLYEVHRPALGSSTYARTLMMWTGAKWTYEGGAYTDFGKPYRTESGSKWRGLKEKPE